MGYELVAVSFMEIKSYSSTAPKQFFCVEMFLIAFN